MDVAPENAWLRDAIRLAFKASAEYHNFDENKGPPEQRDPRLRKLVEGVLWTKTFIITYHFVILGFIFIYSISHWVENAIRWKNRKAATKLAKTESGECDGDAVITYAGPDSEASSSGSSTLGSNTTLVQKGAVETTSLLHEGHQLRPLTPHRSLLSRARACLTYQPRPLPLIHKVLPCNGTSLAILIFIGLQIFYTLYHINFTWFELFVLADRCGLVFAVNLPILYLFAAKTQPLRWLTGYSYESLNIFHRRLGEVLCFEALLHTLGMIGVWFTIFRPSGLSLVPFMLEKVCLLGLGTFICYELLYLTSLGSFRESFYELFLGLHVVLQAGALVFLFFHHPAARPYVSIASAIFIIDRLVYRLVLKSSTVMAHGEVLEDGQTLRLSTDLTIKYPNFFKVLFGNSIINGWQATDHVFVSVSALGKTHLVQAHPFTIASAAPQDGSPVARLELLIRARDGFSKALLEEVLQRRSLKLRLDGPYGSSHARDLLSSSDVAILIAGGSGIAVCWPLVHFLLSLASFDAEQAGGSKRRAIVLIWVIHKTAHLSWIGRTGLQEVEHKGVETIIPQATEEVGRPDLEGIIDGIVAFAGLGKKISIVGSGPDSMGRAIRNTSARLVGDGRKISVTIEKFGW